MYKNWRMPCHYFEKLKNMILEPDPNIGKVENWSLIRIHIRRRVGTKNKLGENETPKASRGGVW